jgi:hypothetical protein
VKQRLLAHAAIGAQVEQEDASLHARACTVADCAVYARGHCELRDAVAVHVVHRRERGAKPLASAQWREGSCAHAVNAISEACAGDHE